MYVIYHVPSKKFGCTSNFPQRCYEQGLSSSTVCVMTDKHKLYRVAAPHFVAGIVVDPHGIIIDAAPILRRWAVHSDLAWFRSYCRLARWEIEEVS